MTAHVIRSDSDARNRWRAVLAHFGVSDVAEPVGAKVYVVVNGDADRATELSTFVHPAEAVYVFGPDDGVREFEIPPEALRVTIPTGELYASQAAAIVLWDRQMKGAH